MQASELESLKSIWIDWKNEDKMNKLFKEYLVRKKIIDKYPALKFKYLWNWYFAVDRDNNWEVEWFADFWVKPFIRIDIMREGMKKTGRYEKILKLTWLEEKKENWIYKMKKDWKDISQFSVEYFNAWCEIMYYETYYYINNLTLEEEEKSLYDSWMLELIWTEKLGSLRIIHIEKKLMKLNYDKASISAIMRVVKRIWPEFLSKWINDERFDKLWDPVTKNELDDYLKKWYIDKELHRQWIELLRKKEEKSRKEKKIKSDTHSSLTDEKNELVA